MTSFLGHAQSLGFSSGPSMIYICHVFFYSNADIYKTVTLQQDETTKIRFRKVLIIQHSRVRFTVNFRKFPLHDGEIGDQKLTVHVEVVNYPDYGSKSTVDEDRTEWTTFKTSVNGWPARAQVSIQIQRFPQALFQRDKIRVLLIANSPRARFSVGLS